MRRSSPPALDIGPFSPLGYLSTAHGYKSSKRFCRSFANSSKSADSARPATGILSPNPSLDCDDVYPLYCLPIFLILLLPPRRLNLELPISPFIMRRRFLYSRFEFLVGIRRFSQSPSCPVLYRYIRYFSAERHRRLRHSGPVFGYLPMCIYSRLLMSTRLSSRSMKNRPIFRPHPFNLALMLFTYAFSISPSTFALLKSRPPLNSHPRVSVVHLDSPSSYIAMSTSYARLTVRIFATLVLFP